MLYAGWHFVCLWKKRDHNSARSSCHLCGQLFCLIGGQSRDARSQRRLRLGPARANARKPFQWDFSEQLTSESFSVDGKTILSEKFTRMNVPDLQVRINAQKLAGHSRFISISLFAPKGWKLKWKTVIGGVERQSEHEFEGEDFHECQNCHFRGNVTEVIVHLLEATLTNSGS